MALPPVQGLGTILPVIPLENTDCHSSLEDFIAMKLEYDDNIDIWTVRDSKGQHIQLETWELSQLLKRLKEEGIR